MRTRDELIEALQAANQRDRRELERRQEFAESPEAIVTRDWQAPASGRPEAVGTLPELEQRAVLEWLEGENQRAATEADTITALREEFDALADGLDGLADEAGSAAGRLEARIIQLERSLDELRSQLEQRNVTPLRSIA